MSVINERIEYLDALKVIAILSIICIHIAIIWPNTKINGCNISNFSEFCRIGVPIFLMVSGGLLLNKNYDLHSFFKKRYSRIILPFILWAIIYIIFILILYLLTGNNIIFNYFNNFPLEWSWYFWMIFGVYLAIPILNEFIINKGIKGAEYFIIIFIISSIFYEICRFFNFSTFIDLRFFLGPIGYIVIGYYLTNKNFNTNVKKIIIISLILFIMASLIKSGWYLIILDYFHLSNDTTIKIFKIIHDYSHLVISDPNIHLLSFIDVDIFEIIQSSSVFLIIKSLYLFNIKSLNKNKIILSISKSSYGMYLVQGVFIIIINRLLYNLSFTNMQVVILLFILSIVTFLLSWISVLIINKIPFINKISGYH